jgi:hypothetical protein
MGPIDITSGPVLKELSRVFRNYSGWRSQWAGSSEHELRQGLLPGDFSTEVELRGVRLGIVGLNNVLEAGRKAETLRAQFDAVCEGGFDRWSRGFDACVVLAHDRLRDLEKEWALRKQGDPFLLHLAGRSAFRGTSPEKAPGAPSLVLPGLALFPFDAHDEHRGYLAGRISFEKDKGRLRIWPRHSALSRSGHVSLEADRSFKLEADEGMEFTSCKARSTTLWPSRSGCSRKRMCRGST